MEVSKKTHNNNNQQKKRVVIKSGGGGGIGAVLLFGGALATAALASAFVFKRKRLSSAKDSRGQPPEVKKQIEKEEEMRIASGDDPSLHAQKHQSEDVTENFEANDDSCLINIAQAQSLSQDELPLGVENSVGIPEADVENVDARDEIPCLETLRMPETDVISDDSITIKKDLQSDQKSSIDLSRSINEEKAQLNGEDSSDVIAASNENYGPELVAFDEENVVRSLTSSGEIPEVMNDEYAVVIKDQSAEENKDAVDMEFIEVENKDAVVIKDIRSTEEENTDAVEIKDMLSSLEEYKNAVVIKEIQVTEENRNNSKPKVNNVEEESGEEVVSDSMEAHQNENMQVDTEETGLEKDGYGDKEIEETASKHIQTPHNMEFQVPVQEEEELISSKDNPDKSCDLEDVSQLKDIEQDADDSNCELENNHHHDVEETIKEDGDSYKTLDTAKDELVMEKGEDIISCDEDETDSSEPHSSELSGGDSSTESNSEALWPAENLQELSIIEPRQAKIFSDREVEGKFLEDKPVKETEPYQSKAEEFKTNQWRYEKLSVQMEKTKDRPIISSTKRRIVIAILLILSSVSGSLIFGLSLVKLCFVAFLTMFLSEMNAY